MESPSLAVPLEAELTLFRHQLSAFKRRRDRRFRCNLATIGRVQFADRAGAGDAYVSNLSEGGVGLNMPQPLEIGQAISIRIRVGSESTHVTLQAEVRHATQEVDQTWRIGCVFVEPISPDVLERILD